MLAIVPQMIGPNGHDTELLAFAPQTANIVTLTGNTNDDVNVTFSDATNFTVSISSGAPTAYSTTTTTKLVYNGPTGFAKLVFDDPFNTYAVNESLTAAAVVAGNFEFDANTVANLYVYLNSNSTATVDVETGVGSNFFVDAANGGYSYFADPIEHIFSELSGVGSVTASGLGSSTYAYVYSAPFANVVGAPKQTTVTLSGVTSTLNFPQVYVIGAADGTDSVTLDSAGGTFAGTPQADFISGTVGGASFVVGAVYVANVTARAAGTGDSAIFTSYKNNAFVGAPGTSSLFGNTTNINGASIQFVVQAIGYDSAAVFESGSGTDAATLTSPGQGTFFGTSTASTLSVGTSTITVNTYFASDGQNIAVPGQIVVTGNHDGSDTATIYDSPGSNALNAINSSVTLTTSSGSTTINDFGSVTANKQNGSSNTVHQQAIDFVLSALGWMSV